MTESAGQQALRYMWSKDNPGVTVKTISEEFDVSIATASKALRTLEVEGLARRDHGRFESRPGFDSDLASRSKMALVFAGGKHGKRTPDIWFATEAGIRLVEERDVDRAMRLANEPVCRCADPGMTDDDMYQCPADNCEAIDYLIGGGAEGAARWPRPMSTGSTANFPPPGDFALERAERYLDEQRGGGGQR